MALESKGRQLGVIYPYTDNTLTEVLIGLTTKALLAENWQGLNGAVAYKLYTSTNDQRVQDEPPDSRDKEH